MTVSHCDAACPSCCPSDPRTIAIGDLELDWRRYRFRVCGFPVPATPQQYRVIEWLIKHPGVYHDHLTMARVVWPDEDVEDDPPTRQKLRTLVCRLRRRLRDAGLEEPRISTRYQYGYGIFSDDQEEQRAA